MHKTREDWLYAAAALLAPLMKIHGAEMPEKFQISTGWAKGGGRKHSIGQCFDKTWTENGTYHLFICPTLAHAVGNMNDGCHGILETLLHELIHASVGIKEKHRGRFKEIAIAVGLEGKMTATGVNPGTILHGQLLTIESQLGPYPHAAMTKPITENKKPPGGGWVKFYSEAAEDYILRVSPVALLTYGIPRDPWGEPMKTNADLELLKQEKADRDAARGKGKDTEDEDEAGEE
jgi:hypothetical protein